MGRRTYGELLALHVVHLLQREVKGRVPGNLEARAVHLELGVDALVAALGVAVLELLVAVRPAAVQDEAVDHLHVRQDGKGLLALGHVAICVSTRHGVPLGCIQRT